MMDWGHMAEAEQRVFTSDLDALEHLIVEGLPPLEMQAAAWALVQRVRGLHDDLRKHARGELLLDEPVGGERVALTGPDSLGELTFEYWNDHCECGHLRRSHDRHLVQCCECSCHKFAIDVSPRRPEEIEVGANSSHSLGAECKLTHVAGYTGPICSCPPLKCAAGSDRDGVARKWRD